MSGQNKTLLAALVFAIIIALAGSAAGEGSAWVGPGSWSGGTWLGGARAGGAWVAGAPRKDMETYTIVFTTQGLLANTANPASLVDTALVWGRATLSKAFVGPTANDFARRLAFASFLYNSCDSLHVLGSTRNVITYAYSEIDTLQPRGVTNSTNDYIHMTSSPRIDNGDGTYSIRETFNTGNRQALMIYVPWEKYVPPGATVNAAYINMCKGSTSFTPTTADAIYAHSIQNVDADKWYAIKGIGIEVDRATVSWRRQQSMGPNGTWSGAVTAYPWSPEFKTVTGSDPFSGRTVKTNFPAGVALNVGFNVDITQIVQDVVDGADNNGMMFTTGVASVNETGSYQTLLPIYESDEYYNTSARGRGMYFVVQYSVPRTFAENKIIQAVGTVTVTYSGGKVGVTHLQLPVGTTGTVHVKYIDANTDEQIGTTKIAGPANVFGTAPLPQIGKVSIPDGETVRIEYICDTDTVGWLPLEEWTIAGTVETSSESPETVLWPNIATPQ